MGKKVHQPLLARGFARRLIAGRFRPDDTNNPVETVGEGFTVVRTGTGAYKITTDDTYERCESCVFHLCSTSLLGHLRSAAAGAKNADGQIEHSVTYLNWVPATPTFTAADIAADANNWIEFQMIVKDTARLP